MSSNANGAQSQTGATAVAVLEALVDRVGNRHMLTSRERQVLCLSASGMETKEVAAKLGCSPKTVEEYWKRMFQKVGQRSRHLIIAQVLLEAMSDLTRDGLPSGYLTDIGRS